MRATKQQGSGVLLAILALAVIAAIGATGWYVWQRQLRTAPNVAAVSLKTYTDSAKLFTLKYPASWVIEPSSPCCEGAPTDFTKVSQPFAFLSPYGPKNAAASGLDILDKTLADNTITAYRTDKFHTIRQLAVDGYVTYFDRDVFTGPGAAERYTDDHYYIYHGDTVLLFSYREMYYHNYPQESWSDMTDLPAFQDVVYSVMFLR